LKGNKNMKVKVRTIQASAKPHRLADASVELADGDGDSLLISDIRVLQNKQGQIWVAMPSRSVSDSGRSFQFVPQVESNRQLQRKIEDAVLAAFEDWKQSNSNLGVRA
jgi:DNA-binding cell septation regulator SpoVG